MPKQRGIHNYPKVFNTYELNNPFSQKQKTNYKFIVIFILIILVIIAAIYYLFYAPTFLIKNIIIQNTQNLSIAQDLDGLKGQNIFKINTTNLSEDLVAKYPEVNGLKITRGLPDTLRISFDERQSKLIWQSNEKYYLVDSYGAIYKIIETPNDLPLVKDNKDINVQIGQTVASENFMKFVTDLTATMQDKTGFSYKHFEVDDTIFQVSVITDQKWLLILDTTRSANDQLDALMQFIGEYPNENISEYIDLRVDGRVYYK